MKENPPLDIFLKTCQSPACHSCWFLSSPTAPCRLWFHYSTETTTQGEFSPVPGPSSAPSSSYTHLACVKPPLGQAMSHTELLFPLTAARRLASPCTHKRLLSYDITGVWRRGRRALGYLVSLQRGGLSMSKNSHMMLNVTLLFLILRIGQCNLFSFFLIKLDLCLSVFQASSHAIFPGQRQALLSELPLGRRLH